jgi:hypothetical protein
MRRPVLAVLAGAALAACGGGSSSTPSPPPPPISGKIFGAPFTPVEGAALELQQATCAIEGVTATATGVLVGFGSFAGLCGVAGQTRGCGGKANATVVNLFVIRANVARGTPAPLAAATYQVTSGTPVVDAQRNATIASAVAVRTDNACVETTASPTATGGTIRLDVVSASRVAGVADLTFDNGDTFSGAFDVAVCSVQMDVCTALAPTCASQSCVP